MLSIGASASDYLRTFIRPGMAANEFNVTVVVFVSDILGSTAVTSLGEDGLPVAIRSTPPDEVGLHTTPVPVMNHDACLELAGLVTRSPACSLGCPNYWIISPTLFLWPLPKIGVKQTQTPANPPVHFA